MKMFTPKRAVIVTANDVEEMEAKKVELEAARDETLAERQVVANSIAVLSAGIESAKNILNIKAALDVVNPPEYVRVVDLGWLKDVDIPGAIK